MELIWMHWKKSFCPSNCAGFFLSPFWQQGIFSAAVPLVATVCHKLTTRLTSKHTHLFFFFLIFFTCFACPHKQQKNLKTKLHVWNWIWKITSNLTFSHSYKHFFLCLIAFLVCCYSLQIMQTKFIVKLRTQKSRWSSSNGKAFCSLT